MSKVPQWKKDAIQREDLYRDKPKQPNKCLRVALPIPPSVNDLHFHTRYGGKRLKPKAREYIRDSRALINLAIEEQHWEVPSVCTWLYIDMVFYMPDRKIRDSHNCLKILLDVMEEIVFINDYYVMPRIQGVEYDKENPRVEVVIIPQTRNNRIKGLKVTQVVV